MADNRFAYLSNAYKCSTLTTDHRQTLTSATRARVYQVLAVWMVPTTLYVCVDLGTKDVGVKQVGAVCDLELYFSVVLTIYSCSVLPRQFGFSCWYCSVTHSTGFSMDCFTSSDINIHCTMVGTRILTSLYTSCCRDRRVC